MGNNQTTQSTQSTQSTVSTQNDFNKLSEFELYEIVQSKINNPAGLHRLIRLMQFQYPEDSQSDIYRRILCDHERDKWLGLSRPS